MSIEGVPNLVRMSRSGNVPSRDETRGICFGAFVLDRGRGLLMRRGTPIPLGKRGIRLIDALASRPGETISKAELLEIGWPNATVEESNLSVQIALLRKAIGLAPNGTEWIVTVPRVGYFFSNTDRGGYVDLAPDVSPTLAVLPLACVGSGGELEELAEGLTEELIFALSRVGGITVISRSSSATYRHRSVDVRRVSAELGARYILEGKVRRSGNRLRVTAQLVDGAAGSQLWAERYDHVFAEFFSVQDDVSRRIAAELVSLLNPGEVTLWPIISTRGTRSVEAYRLFLRGRAMQRGPVRTRAVHARSDQLFRQAIAIDPDYAAPYAALAMGSAYAYYYNWTADPAVSLATAYELVDQAISRDADDAYIHGIAALVAMYARDMERWAFEVEEALALDCNFAPALALRATLRLCSGDPEVAIKDLQRAMRLDPHFTHHYLHDLGVAYLAAGHYEAATAAFQERLLLVPDANETRAYLASALGSLGQLEEAREIWAEIMELNPAFAFQDRISSLTFRNQEDFARITSGLKRADLPMPSLRSL